MKYIVIEARAPQDGSPAKTALLMFPKWISSTLVCAGIVGRVIELTDGNIIEEGDMPVDEETCLETIREKAAADAELQQEKELPLTGSEGRAAGLPSTDPVAVEDAYREGMQKQRTLMAETFTKHGMPQGTPMGEWITAELVELAALRKRYLQTADSPELIDSYQSLQEDFTSAQAELQLTKDLLAVSKDNVTALEKAVKFLEEQASRHPFDIAKELNTPFGAATPTLNITGPVTIHIGKV